MKAVGVVLLLLMVVLPLYYFNQLPETVPIHYNSAGEPDGYSDRTAIFVADSHRMDSVHRAISSDPAPSGVLRSRKDQPGNG